MSTVLDGAGVKFSEYSSQNHHHHGDSWKTVGKHPLLELKHTVEDRLLVATHINFLGLRAMLHRNQDGVVLFSDTIDEPKHAGNAVGLGPLSRPPDRLLILTDRHLYVCSSPSTAIFSPSSSGSCHSLSEFSRMATVVNSSAAIIQFVGGIIAARFSTKKDAQRCATAVYTATGIPSETLTSEELDVLHQRRLFGSSNLISKFVYQTVRESNSKTPSKNEKNETAAGSSPSAESTIGGAGGSTTTPGGRKRILKSDNGAVTNTVDNMLRFVLDGESELGGFDAGFPDVGIQATCDTAEVEIDARPQTQDAATSPIDPALLGGGGDPSNSSGSIMRGGLNTRSYARRFELDSDDEFEDGAFASSSAKQGTTNASNMFLNKGNKNQSPAANANNAPEIGAAVWSSLKNPSPGSGSVSSGNRNVQQKQQQQFQEQQQQQQQAQKSGINNSPSPSSSAKNQQQQQNQHQHTDPFLSAGGSDTWSFTNASLIGGAGNNTRISPSANTGGGGGKVVGMEDFSTLPQSGGGGLQHSSGAGGGMGVREASNQSAASASASGAGGPQRENPAFDAWLGVLSNYRRTMEEQGITSVNRLLRIPPGPEWEMFLDNCGIQRAGHRVLLTTKANASRK